ncbi:MAG: S9 family peptidase [Rikenellaceae bacterium]|nr:S9 family peptidase [Rikenellaceae bacterium]
MALLALLSAPAEAAERFTYDDLSRGLFAQRTVGGVRSMGDGQHFSTLSQGQISRFSYKTGEATALVFDGETIAPGLRITDYRFSADERKILLVTDPRPIYRHSFTADHYIYSIPEKTLKRLSEGGSQQVASFSPDGTMCAFVRDNDLFVKDLHAGTERQITSDGLFNHIINGIPDWVYEEEFAFSQAYAWSPDSRTIAFYRFDESRVKQYLMNRFDGQLYPSVYAFKYPKAGEENAIVTIHIHDIASGRTTTVDTGAETDQYIPRISWTPDNRLAMLRVNRPQNHFEMLLADPATGASHVVYDEKNPRYVERIDDETITFIDADRFLVKSERDGFFHIYLYSISKGFLNQVTRGPWEVTQLLGVDVKKGAVYFLSCETSPLRRNLYSIGIDGTGKKRLTTGEGTYRIEFSNNFQYYISYFSNAATPNIVTLHQADGKQLRVLENNTRLKERIAEYQLPVKEFFTFTTSEGIELYGYILKPHNFDPAKKYPMLMTQYSGPGSQSVADKWTMGWEDALVQENFLVGCVDGRGTGFRGENFKKCTYKQLGHYELSDQIEAARYFGKLAYVDTERIGIYGWSYGGFMSLNCILKGGGVFKMAIAVAPVTNWRFYDTIYTEIYNGLPGENPSGYDDNSPIFFADRLEGKLLIAHGTADDNVHVQNTMEMVDRFVQAGKSYEIYLYPDKNHGMAPGARDHLMLRCIEFVRRNL